MMMIEPISLGCGLPIPFRQCHHGLVPPVAVDHYEPRCLQQTVQGSDSAALRCLLRHPVIWLPSPRQRDH